MAYSNLLGNENASGSARMLRNIASMRGLISLVVRRAGQFQHEEVRRQWVGSFLGHDAIYIDYVLSSADAEIAKQNLEEVRRRVSVLEDVSRKTESQLQSRYSQARQSQFSHNKKALPTKESGQSFSNDNTVTYRSRIAFEVDMMRRDLLRTAVDQR